MTRPKRLVLDANILLRAVFGVRVLALLQTYDDHIFFCSPDVCFADATRYVAEIAERRGFDAAAAFTVLEQLGRLVGTIDADLYATHKEAALARIALRDASDWPIAATALLLEAPVWTEDQDFFGTGLATWTTDRVEVYLKRE